MSYGPFTSALVASGYFEKVAAMEKQASPMQAVKNWGQLAGYGAQQLASNPVARMGAGALGGAALGGAAGHMYGAPEEFMGIEYGGHPNAGLAGALGGAALGAGGVAAAQYGPEALMALRRHLAGRAAVNAMNAAGEVPTLPWPASMGPSGAGSFVRQGIDRPSAAVVSPVSRRSVTTA